MKERPILFSAPMVPAIRAGHKTQTRQIAKLNAAGRVARAGRNWHCDDPEARLACPYGQPGDRLWVRESFRFPSTLDGDSPAQVAERAIEAGYRRPWCPTVYEADGHRTSDWRGFVTPPAQAEPGKLRPGIHMPRWASRITLEVTGVRVERLQEISPQDVRAEGCEVREFWLFGADAAERQRIAANVYRSLWEQINGAGSWEANPWVWVVSFRRIRPDA